MSDNKPYSVIVRESLVDSYGHLNNASYLSLYEEARWELITKRGFDFKTIHTIQQGPVILEVNIKFLKEIVLREEITISTEVLSYSGKIGKMRQQMFKQDGSVANEAQFVFALFDMKMRKLIEPTFEWKKAIGIE